MRRIRRRAGGSVVLGTAADSELITVPLFTERGFLAAALGDAGLPKLIALRALGAGARLQVVTSCPASWLMLRAGARLGAAAMTVVGPGTPPPTGCSRAAPWLIIDDTGSPAAAAVRTPWLAFVAAPSSDGVTIAGLRGLDAIILQRSTPACRAAVIVAMNLPVPVVRSLHGIPRDVITVARPGTVEFAALTPDPAEQALLAGSWPARPTSADPAWPGSPTLAELGPRIWSGTDRLLAPALTGSVSLGSRNGSAGRNDA
jgi:hypothetical protein